MGYGLWGGFGPGGWCRFRVASGGDHLGYAVEGTEAEAIAAKAAFEKEFVSDETKASAAYTVMPFDPNREPAATPGMPTPAQRKLLEYVGRTGSVDSWPRPARATLTAVIDRGWVMWTTAGPGARLTRAGIVALVG